MIFFTMLLVALAGCSPSSVRYPTFRLPETQPVPTTGYTLHPIIQSTATQFTDKIFIEHAQIVYYDVNGSTAHELRTSMNKLRPKDPHTDNHPVDAYTDWYISWNWPGYGTENCDLSAAHVTYSIKVILPRWVQPIDVSSELIIQWETYIQNLLIHEKGHVDNVVNNYLSVDAAIQSATCSTANAQAEKALATLREFDLNYDRETKHGETQGAVFP